MADQTPDQWAHVRAEIVRVVFAPGHQRALIDEIDAARDAERQQHQQAIAGHEAVFHNACLRIADTEAIVSQRDETIQQQAAQIETLTQALKQADDAIVDGQACRSEAEFTRWMHRSQQARPTANLLAVASRPTEGEQGAPQVGLSSMLNAPTLLRQRVNQALAALASPPPTPDVERLKALAARWRAEALDRMASGPTAFRICAQELEFALGVGDTSTPGGEQL